MDIDRNLFVCFFGNIGIVLMIIFGFFDLIVVRLFFKLFGCFIIIMCDEWGVMLFFYVKMFLIEMLKYVFIYYGVMSLCFM